MAKRHGHLFAGEEGRTLVLLSLPLAFLAVFFVLPLAAVVGVSFFPDGQFSLSSYQALAGSGAFWSILRRTLVLSGYVSVLCLALGYPFAYVLSRSNGWTHRLMLFAVTMPFFTSVLIRSYAWVALLGNRGPINQALVGLGVVDSPIPLVYNEIGALIGMTQVQLPLMILTLYGTMRRMDMQLIQAADSLGAHRIVSFFRIYLPLSMPGIAAGLGLVFTSTLGFYVTPALLGGASEYMISQSIYVQLNTLNDFAGSAAQASVLLIIVLLLLLVLRKVVGTDRLAAEQPASSPVRGFGISGWPEAMVRVLGPLATPLWVVIQAICWIAVAVGAVFMTATMLTVIPLGFSADSYLRFPPTSFSLRWIQSYAVDPEWLGSTWFSIWISLAGSLLATVFGSLAAYAVTRLGRNRLRPSVELLCIAPMIVPQFVLALALYFLFIKTGLVGSAIPYVLCYGVFAFPFVFLIMHAAFQTFDLSMVQAAESLGARSRTIWQSVIIPILLPSFVSAAGFAFLTAFDDLVVALFFSSAGQYTLPMRMWADIKNEVSPKIAAVAVVFFAVALIATIIITLIRRVRQSGRIAVA